ncbi:hypothetical protein XarbCFBP8147_18905 [Xanthomonas arboricola]|nr:hypothetical protein XarbCFBP8147_18905 [Xanthomonas arboricola]
MQVPRWRAIRPMARPHQKIESARAYSARERALVARTVIKQRTSCFACTTHTDHPDRSLPAHRRGTLRGMDAAYEPTWTYLRRVLRWWAGKGPQPGHRSHASTLFLSLAFGSSKSPGLGPE